MESTIENSDKKNTARRNAESHFAVWERRTQLVKDQLCAESAARDARTSRLRALRLEKEAADMLAAPEPQPQKAPVRRRTVIKA